MIKLKAKDLVKVGNLRDSSTPRPRVCLDITNSGQDMLYLSRIPKGMTYDRLLELVEPFGEVEALNWSASDPYVCEVVYADPYAAREAIHFLDDAMVGGESEPPLQAKLRSREPGAQLFVGDLTPDVTESMLEQTFMKLVGSAVTAILKRDPESFSPIGYGFLSFQSEAAANIALVAGHRAKVGNACIRVGRAERNTHLYITDLSPDVGMGELQGLFGKFGDLVEEDTVIVRRSYAFVRYRDRLSAERAKRTLDKTDLRGRITVRYAEAEPLKACISVQFHSSVPRPPGSLRELLVATFSKYGNCSVEIPRLRNGMWRKVAFVTFHGEPISATLAATEAVQSVRFVSTVPVCCQFARELIPRVPPRDLRVERCENPSGAGHDLPTGPRARTAWTGNAVGAAPQQARAATVPTDGNIPGMANIARGASQSHAELVPVYVPMSALHPLPMQQSHVNVAETDYTAATNWEGRMFPGENGPSQHSRIFAARSGPSSGTAHSERQW